MLQRVRVLLPALWAGFLVCVASLATPSAFALLARPDAGRVVARMLAQEAYTSLALGVAVLLVERAFARRLAAAGQDSVLSGGVVLALAALFCTVAGYFGVQPLMAAARAGQGALGFGALHAISTGFFAVKLVLVLVLAWRAAEPPAS